MVSRANIRMVKANKTTSKTLRISPETIYKTLYFRSREALHHLNIRHLRRSHSLRHGKRHTRKGERGTINIVNGTPILNVPEISITDALWGIGRAIQSQVQKLSYSHTCRPKITLYDHPQTQGQRFCLSKSGSYRQIPEFTVRTQKITDMGQRNGTGQTSRIYCQHRR